MCGLLRVLEKRKDPGRVRARLRDSCPGVVFLVWGNPEVYAERKTSRKDTKTARVCRAVFVVSLLERSLLDEHARERREGRLDFGAHVDQFRSLGIVAKWCLFGTDRLFVRVREKKRKVRGGAGKSERFRCGRRIPMKKAAVTRTAAPNFGGRRGNQCLLRGKGFRRRFRKLPTLFPTLTSGQLGCFGPTRAAFPSKTP